MEDNDPTGMTAAERRARSVKGAHTKWKNNPDHSAGTEAMRTAANVTRFEDEVDPERKLDPQARAVLVKNARSAHMADLALKSLKARRLRRQADQLEAEVEQADNRES